MSTKLSLLEQYLVVKENWVIIILTGHWAIAVTKPGPDCRSCPGQFSASIISLTKQGRRGWSLVGGQWDSDPLYLHLLQQEN